MRFPTRSVAKAPDQPAPKSASLPAADRQGKVRTYVVREVAILEVSGHLGDVVGELDRAIQLALAEGPHGVVCDLSAALDGARPVPTELLATAGRHVRDWPGIPVAVASPDPQVREALRAQPLGRHLIVTSSLFSAVTAVRAAPTLDVKTKRLAPHPTAPSAARQFVTRTLLDWSLGRVLPFASLVVSELVANSADDAGTEIDLSIVWDQDALRLTIRDHGPAKPGQRPTPLDLVGRRLTVVAGLSRAFGVLPTADGGKLVWAVLDAPRSIPSTNAHSSAAERQEGLIGQHSRALENSLLRGDPKHLPASGVPTRAPQGVLSLVQ
ncbi:MAG: ATP-binding protein [Dermatophilaceae bacterium]|nr:ATP-binding protein [Dermatophilaceae bacterium]